MFLPGKQDLRVVRFLRGVQHERWTKSLVRKDQQVSGSGAVLSKGFGGVMGKLFPDKVVYDDQKDICTMLFEGSCSRIGARK